MESGLEAIIESKIITPDLEYAVVKIPGKEDVYIVRTSNNNYIDASKLEKYVSGYKEKKGLKKGIESINELNELLKNYINSGEKQLLDKFLQTNGYSSSKILEGREASNIIDQAVAYTDTETVLGVYLNFKKAIEKMARQGKIPEKIAKYITVTHELIHTAQSTDLESLVANEKAYRLNVEYEAEMLLTALLYNKAANSKSKKESREWYTAARYTLHRAQVLEEWSRRKNTPLEKKEKLTNLVENYFNQYSDYLNKDSTPKSKNIFMPKPIYNPI